MKDTERETLKRIYSQLSAARVGLGPAEINTPNSYAALREVLDDLKELIEAES